MGGLTHSDTCKRGTIRLAQLAEAAQNTSASAGEETLRARVTELEEKETQQMRTLADIGAEMQEVRSENAEVCFACFYFARPVCC